MITTEKLKMIKENLPQYHLKRLFQNLNGKYSISLIEKVLNGKRNNEEVLEAAVELAHQHQARKTALQERIASIN